MLNEVDLAEFIDNAVGKIMGKPIAFDEADTSTKILIKICEEILRKYVIIAWPISSTNFMEEKKQASENLGALVFSSGGEGVGAKLKPAPKCGADCTTADIPNSL